MDCCNPQRHPAIGIVLLAAALLLACSDDAGSSVDAADAADADVDEEPAVPPEEAVDAFCVELVEAFCQRVDDCACGGNAGERCRGSGAVCPLGQPSMRTAIADGELLFDAVSAAAIVAAVDASDNCGDFESLLGWTVGDVLSYGGAITGTIPIGSDCTTLIPETPFSACDGGICAAGLCVAIAGEQEPCDEETICLFLDQAPSAVTGDDVINVCVEDTAICAGNLPVDARCEADVACESGLCDGGRCGLVSANGEPCIESTDCRSGRCDLSTLECARPLPLDGECRQHADCDSGFCSRPVGVATGSCAQPSGAGRPCDEATPVVCASQTCINSTCVEPICVPFL